MPSFKAKGKAYRKRLIAEEAFKLFAYQPFETVTVDKIAQTVGCGKGTIYQYFGNKEQILNYLIYDGLEKLCLDIEEKCLHNTDTLKAIEKYLEIQFEFFLQYSQLFSSWLRITGQKDRVSYQMIDKIEAKFEEKLNLVATIFEKGVKEKLLRDINGYDLAKIAETVFRSCTFTFFPERELHKSPEYILNTLKNILGNGMLREGQIFGKPVADSTKI